MLGSQETESAVWKLGGFSGHTAWAAAPGLGGSSVQGGRGYVWGGGD